MAQQRIGVVEDPNDPRYGEYLYGDNNADEAGNLPTDRDYQPPNLGYVQGPAPDNSPPAGYHLVDDSKNGGAIGYMPNDPATSSTGATPSPAGGSSSSQYSNIQAAVTPPSMTPWNGAPAPTITRPKIQNAFSGPLQEAILKLLGTNTSPDADELSKTPQNMAGRLAAQRAYERDKGQLAEEASSEGWSDSGAFDAADAGLRQRRGETEVQLLSGIADAEVARRIQQLQYGIQVAEARGQFEASQDMQAQLANLDAIMRRNQLSEQAREYDLGLGYDYTSLGVNSNQAALQEIMRGL